MDELTFNEIESIYGYLGCEAFKEENDFGVNVSYWKDNTLQKQEKLLGIEKWDKKFKVRICTVQRDYELINATS